MRTFIYFLYLPFSMKKLVRGGLLFLAVLLVSCIPVPSTNQTSESAPLTGNVSPSPLSAPEPLPVPEPVPEINLSCSVNADCEQGTSCINGQCRSITSLYNTDCDNKCTFTELTFSTSDGDTYTLKEGQGSYTAAGAVEWKVATVPDFCPDENVVVPLRIIKKNYGKILSEEVVTLAEGQTSGTITHPAISSIKFTVKADRVGKECS